MRSWAAANGRRRMRIWSSPSSARTGVIAWISTRRRILKLSRAARATCCAGPKSAALRTAGDSAQARQTGEHQRPGRGLGHGGRDIAGELDDEAAVVVHADA